jgi:hypothetical protein
MELSEIFARRVHPSIGTRRVQARFLARRLVSRLWKPDLLVAGQFHGGNFGDWLLFESVNRVAKCKRLKCAPLVMHKADRHMQWRDVPLLVGGGNSLEPHSLSSLAAFRLGATCPFAGIGMDFNSAEVFSQFRSLFGGMRKIGFRDAQAAALAKSHLPEPTARRVLQSPDLGWFGAEQVHRSLKLPANKTNRIGINILPLYLTRRKDRFVWCTKQSDSFFDQAARETSAYFQAVTGYVRGLLNAGKEVVHVPFDSSDEMLARVWLKPMGVRCFDYSLDIAAVLQLMSTCSEFVATRFHAMLCALACGVPCKPISYGRKNIILLESYGDNFWCKLSPRHFAENPSTMLDALNNAEAFCMRQSHIRNLSSGAERAIGCVIDSLPMSTSAYVDDDVSTARTALNEP